ncbi:MAG: gp53-like domain-containing protein [Candidatus Dormibacteria bacterium]
MTGKGGDGLYEVCFVSDELAVYGVGAHAPNFHVVKGKQPYDTRVHRLQQFLVVNSAIAGNRELRVIGGVGGSNIQDGAVTTTHLAPGVGVPFSTVAVSAYAVPALGVSGTLNVTNGATFAADQYIQAAGGATPFVGLITAIASNVLTVTTLQVGSTTPLPIGTVVAFGGPAIPAVSGLSAANGWAALPGVGIFQWGGIAAVAADGSAASTITFPVAFSGNAWQVIPTIDNAYQTNPWGLTIQVTALTATTAQVNVAGGPAGSTVTVRFSATGPSPTGSGAANGSAVFPQVAVLAWGSVASVAADGSAATAVVFPSAFGTACWQVMACIDNPYQTNPWGLTIQTDSPSKTGFNVNVAGAPASSTVTVRYYAIGL